MIFSHVEVGDILKYTGGVNEYHYLVLETYPAHKDGGREFYILALETGAKSKISLSWSDTPYFQKVA